MKLNWNQRVALCLEGVPHMVYCMRILISKIFKNVSRGCYPVTSLKISVSEIWENYCFSSSGKVKIENNVVGDNRLIPEGKITLFYSKEFTYYMLKFELGNFEMYFFRLWPEGQRFLCDSTEYSSDETDDSGIDFPDSWFVVFNLWMS